MPLAKQTLNINFAQGLQTKADPFQVAPGRFLRLVNSVFDRVGRLQKRNGFGYLPFLESEAALAIYGGNLIALNTSLSSYSSESKSWGNKGPYTNVSLSTLPVVRSSTSQEAIDVAIAPSGLGCAVWIDSGGGSYYQIFDSGTGEIQIVKTALPSSAVMARSFVLGRYFIITFLATVSAASHLQYIAIPITNPGNPGAATTFSSFTASGLSAPYDGYIANNNLYLALNASDGGGAIRITYLDSTLIQHSVVLISGEMAANLSVTADTTVSPLQAWVSWWDSGGTLYTQAFSNILVAIGSKKSMGSIADVDQLTSIARGSVNTLYYEISNDYSGTMVASDFIQTNTCTLAGTTYTAGTETTLIRSLGIAGKPVYVDDTENIYLLCAYQGQFQPTYFLIDQLGNTAARIAYSNGAGYPINQVLSQPWLYGSIVYYGYQFQDQVQPINKSQSGVASPVYANTGINLIALNFDPGSVATSDIGQNLHMGGGFLWMYDGVRPVEHNFFIWPENIQASWSASGGDMAAQPDGTTNDSAYFYQIAYEWNDAKGNIHRSAPSIPIGITTTGSGTSGSVTLLIPTLRVTYKGVSNPVTIVLYRWSVAQQTYYQTTVAVNDETADLVTVVDTHSDAQIIGNNIIYTNGGVIENISAPGTEITTLYRSRLFLVDSEDQNLLWYSKQVIENTPVEMSDLFTFYVAPTQGARGSTGPMTALSAMDDKLIIFKKDAIYYVTGNGPNDLGTNNDFSDPVFITSSVGCSNPESIAFIPSGLMFQSDKGIWLLGRDLSTQYIGDAVEQFNNIPVVGALSIPGTNQARFALQNGTVLMYDYYVNQWGSFQGNAQTSSVLYQGLHTYINSIGQLFQETPGLYLDGTSPVLMGFTSSWFNLAGLQGYQRAYCFYLLATYLSPHKLSLSIAYDYSPTTQQQTIISPSNFSPAYGVDTPYGQGSPYGGPGQLEQWRVFLSRQRCQAFQISLDEIYDPVFGVAAGAGLALSGLACVLGIKKGYKAAIRAQDGVG